MSATLEAKPLLDRLEDKVLVGDGCWEWTGARHPEGYGHFRERRNVLNAHRVIYELMHGPIPAGMTLDHLCRNRGCVNPSHMEIVSRAENILRGEGPAAINARKVRCIRGHPLDDEGDVYVTKDGRRDCRACRRERRRRGICRPTATSGGENVGR